MTDGWKHPKKPPRMKRRNRRMSFYDPYTGKTEQWRKWLDIAIACAFGCIAGYAIGCMIYVSAARAALEGIQKGLK